MLIEATDIYQTCARSHPHLDRDHVRRLRLAAGFTSDESLARAAGLSHGHLWQCLAGRIAPGPKVLTGLLRALPAAKLADLLTWTNSENTAATL